MDSVQLDKLMEQSVVLKESLGTKRVKIGHAVVLTNLLQERSLVDEGVMLLGLQPQAQHPQPVAFEREGAACQLVAWQLVTSPSFHWSEPTDFPYFLLMVFRYDNRGRCTRSSNVYLAQFQADNHDPVTRLANRLVIVEKLCLACSERRAGTKADAHTLVTARQDFREGSSKVLDLWLKSCGKVKKHDYVLTLNSARLGFDSEGLADSFSVKTYVQAAPNKLGGNLPMVVDIDSVFKSPDVLFYTRKRIYHLLK